VAAPCNGLWGEVCCDHRRLLNGCCLVTGAVLAIEMLAACQAMEFIRPLTTTAPLEAVYRLVRANIP